VTSPSFTLADPVVHREALLDINLEYVSWVAAGIEALSGISVAALVGMPLPEYVASMLPKVCGDTPPRGAFYLVELDGKVAGMGGLRRVRAGVAEMKRLYVRPACRGNRLGEAILQRVLDDARAFGYQRILLDTAPFMPAAQRLYEAAGFSDCEPYPEAETPVELRRNWRFMERAL
jgi:N-acetylglutamate synthase-like GNAT family acetyltransferase